MVCDPFMRLQNMRDTDKVTRKDRHTEGFKGEKFRRCRIRARKPNTVWYHVPQQL